MVYTKLSELHKLEGNPRTIKKDDLDKLKQSIQNSPDYFEARPLILSNRTGKLVILGGNQRYEASKALGLEKVPTHLIEGLTEEREREIIIRDNVNNGEWDFDILANEWGAEDLDEWGVSLPGDFTETDTGPVDNPQTELKSIVVLAYDDVNDLDLITDLYNLESIDMPDDVKASLASQRKAYVFKK